MVAMDVERRCIGGTHITPLTQNIILDPPPPALGGLEVPDVTAGARQQVREAFLGTVNIVKMEILDWLELKKIRKASPNVSSSDSSSENDVRHN